MLSSVFVISFFILTVKSLTESAIDRSPACGIADAVSRMLTVSRAPVRRYAHRIFSRTATALSVAQTLLDHFHSGEWASAAGAAFHSRVLKLIQIPGEQSNGIVWSIGRGNAAGKPSYELPNAGSRFRFTEQCSSSADSLAYSILPPCAATLPFCVWLCKSYQSQTGGPACRRTRKPDRERIITTIVKPAADSGI
jgi:hypothetical protein